MKPIWLAVCGLCAFANVQAETPVFTWQQNATHLALLNHGQTVWQAVFDPAQGKPYVQLATLDGAELTALRPKDHPWHRGLWWSWKYINHTNYWEEDKQTGLSAGRTEIAAAHVACARDFSARVEMELVYRLPGQPPVMTEHRVLACSAPTADGRYTIDWTAEFKMQQDVVLERTPPTKTSGGYAGLSLRFPPTFSKEWKFLTSAGRNDAVGGNGEKARWVDFSGPAADGTVAGVTVYDHPENLRHPSPWYLNQIHPFFSPALLYTAPLDCKAGAALKLRYRISLRAGAPIPTELERGWREFSGKE